MGASAWLMFFLQGLLFLPKVASLAAFTDDADRLRRHQKHDAHTAALKATMDSHGRMEVKRHHHKAHQLVRSEGFTQATAMKSMYPFYHTTDELKTEAVRLSKSCGGAMNISTVNDGDVQIDIISVRKPSAKPTNKVFILFGEHSRELISPESGLHFLKGLCGEVHLSGPSLAEGGSAGDNHDILEDAEFQMVLNSNPRSRRKVEEGDYCLRVNPDGVDLNRNWDEEWQQEAATFGGDSNPGPSPFSEPETRIFKKALTDFAPTVFLTVHSGTRGMYMPWAYDMEHLAQYNEPSMMEILRKMDKDHCECPFGAAGKEVGYPCPGTCLDYAYGKLNTPFVFAFEIYTSPQSDESLKSRWQEKMDDGGALLLEQGHHLGHPHFRHFFSEHTSDFVHVGSSKTSFLQVKAEVDASDPSNDGCFEMFNPGSKEEYEKVVKNWAETYLQMTVLTGQKVKAGLPAKPEPANSPPVTPVQ